MVFIKYLILNRIIEFFHEWDDEEVLGFFGIIVEVVELGNFQK